MVLGALALPLLLPSAALAQQQAQAVKAESEKVVALLPCNGKEAAVPPRKPLEQERTARAVLELLRERPGARYKVLSAERWREVARRRFGGRTTELQSIARELKADLAVGCWVEVRSEGEAGKPYQLTVALYDNWAQPLGQVSFDLDRPRFDGQALIDQAGALYRNVDLALGLIAPEPKRVGGPPRLGAVAQAEDSETAPLPAQQPVRGPGADVPLVPPNAEAQALYYKRPPWRPIFDLQVGYLFNTRQLTDNGSGRAFNRSGAHGLRLHGEIYPLAAVRAVPLAAAGLGFRVTAMLPFWPDIKQVNGKGDQTGLYGANETRVEVGWLRWHYNFLSAALRPDAAVQPEIELEGLYGYHRFDFTAKENILVFDIPSATYQYVGGAFGLRLHILRRLQLRFGMAFAGLLDLGPMAEPGAPNDYPPNVPRAYHVYGPGGGWLFRTDLAASVRLVAGLHLGLGGYFEQTQLSFDGTGDVLLLQQPAEGPKQKVTSAKDEFGGFFLTLGYAY